MALLEMASFQNLQVAAVVVAMVLALEPMLFARPHRPWPWPLGLQSGRDPSHFLHQLLALQFWQQSEDSVLQEEDLLALVLQQEEEPLALELQEAWHWLAGQYWLQPYAFQPAPSASIPAIAEPNDSLQCSLGLLVEDQKELELVALLELPSNPPHPSRSTAYLSTELLSPASGQFWGAPPA